MDNQITTVENNFGGTNMGVIEYARKKLNSKAHALYQAMYSGTIQNEVDYTSKSWSNDDLKDAQAVLDSLKAAAQELVTQLESYVAGESS